MEKVPSKRVPRFLTPFFSCCLLIAQDNISGMASALPATQEHTNLSLGEVSSKELHLVGLFGKEGDYPVGWAFQLAAEMAVNDINNRSDLLPGYSLVLDSIDTKCDSFEGIDQLYRQLFQTNKTVVMVLGGTTSHVTELTARASRRYNLVQVTFSAVSPTLSNKDVFPWLFRLMAPESIHSYVRVLLLEQLGWRHVWVAQQSFHLFSSSVEVMKKELEKRNISLEGIQPFDGDPTFVIENLQKNDARIIYFASYAEKARQACCVAYSRNFYGPHIVWIFPGFYDTNWYLSINDTNCSTQDIMQVIDGYLTIVDVTLDDAGDKDGDNIVSGWPPSQFACRYCAHYRNIQYTPEFGGDDCLCDRAPRDPRLSGSNRAPLGYDSVWASALALNTTLTTLLAHGGKLLLEDFSYDNVNLGKTIYNSMKDVTFRGLSGSISFTNTGDRIAKIQVMQFQWDAKTSSGRLVKIGDYANCSEEIVWDEEEAKWTEGSSIVKVGQYRGCPEKMKWNVALAKWRGHGVPPSHRLTVYVLQPLAWRHYVVMCSLAGLGMLLSFAFLTFNLRHRNVRLIKMSSPRINNLILAGCLLVYSTVFMEDVYASKLDILCYLQQYAMVLGFSLGYGALFAKTWRVYEIMTASCKLRRKALRDCRLFLTVGLLVGINVAVLVVRTVVDPVAMVPVDCEDVTEQDSRKDVLEVSQSLVCHSRYRIHFTAVLLSLQGLLIVFGVFLAWQTRKTAIPELNDSRWIGLCIYNVVVLGSVGVILVLGTRQEPHVTYLLESAIVTAGTTLTQCFVFIPKLTAYKQWLHAHKPSEAGVLTTRTIYVTGPSSVTSAFAFHKPSLSTASTPDTTDTPDTSSTSVFSIGPSSHTTTAATCSCSGRAVEKNDVDDSQDESEKPADRKPPPDIDRSHQHSHRLLRATTSSTDILGNRGSGGLSAPSVVVVEESASRPCALTPDHPASILSSARRPQVPTTCHCAWRQPHEDGVSVSRHFQTMDLLSAATSSLAAAILSPRHAHLRLTQSHFRRVRTGKKSARHGVSPKRSLSFDTLDVYVAHAQSPDRCGHGLLHDLGFRPPAGPRHGAGLSELDVCCAHAPCRASSHPFFACDCQCHPLVCRCACRGGVCTESRAAASTSCGIHRFGSRVQTPEVPPLTLLTSSQILMAASPTQLAFP